MFYELISSHSQPFWGSMVATAGAGPEPLPYKALSREKIAELMRFCLTPEALHAAKGIAIKMRAESGVKTAVESFHKALPQKNFHCDILPSLPASWTYGSGRSRIKLSRIAAQALSNHLKVDLHKLQL